MKEDLLIKSVLFGGFDKKEVLSLIEKIQSEHFDESETVKRKDIEIETVKAKVAQFEDRLDSEKRRFSALAALNDEYCERIYNLEEQIKEQNAKFNSIQEDCNRLKKVETQIGALLVDAVLYSDKMTEKAKKAASNITSDAKQALASTAEDVGRLSLEISQLSGDFRNDITALVEKVEILSASLCTFTARFETEFDVSREEAYDGQEVFEHFITQYENSKIKELADEDTKSAVTPQNDEQQSANPQKTEITANEYISEEAIDEQFEDDVLEPETDENDRLVSAENATASGSEVIQDSKTDEPDENLTDDESAVPPLIAEQEIIDKIETDFTEVATDDFVINQTNQNETVTLANKNEILGIHIINKKDDNEDIDENNQTEKTELPADLNEYEESDLTEEPAESISEPVETEKAFVISENTGNVDTIISDAESEKDANETDDKLIAETTEESADTVEEIIAATESEPETRQNIEPKPEPEPEPEQDVIYEIEMAIEPANENAVQDEMEVEEIPGKSRDISESDVDELLKLFSE